jgi:cell shape-determining protein MreC
MNKEKELGIIRDELAYIGRYMQSISPKISRYQELKTKKELLQKRMKELKKLSTVAL